MAKVTRRVHIRRAGIAVPVAACAMLAAMLPAPLPATSPPVPRGNAGAKSGSPVTVTANNATFASVAFADLPGWSEDDHLAAMKAFLVSCPRLASGNKSANNNKSADNKSPRTPSQAALVAACDAALKLPARITRTAARTFFEQHFRPERVLHAAPHGLLTGYYEPLLEGSRKREGRFQTPILRRPADLVNLVDEASRGTVGKQLSHARRTPVGLVPFATRAEIEAGALQKQGLELLYLADDVDVFFLQIQGSGRIKLTDGSIVRVQYDGKNGHPYTSIGRYLIDKGLLAADKVSMAGLGRWLRADPARGRTVMQQNASYVFFREMSAGAEGPLGVLEIPLTPGRSLAVDTSVHALGAPVYVSAPTLTHALKGRPYNRLMIAQDVGSAIRGPERGDIYFGSGEAAGRLAGITKHPGHLFVLRAQTQGEGIVTGGSSKPGAQRSQQ